MRIRARACLYCLRLAAWLDPSLSAEFERFRVLVSDAASLEAEYARMHGEMAVRYGQVNALASASATEVNDLLLATAEANLATDRLYGESESVPFGDTLSGSRPEPVTDVPRALQPIAMAEVPKGTVVITDANGAPLQLITGVFFQEDNEEY